MSTLPTVLCRQTEIRQIINKQTDKKKQDCHLLNLKRTIKIEACLDSLSEYLNITSDSTYLYFGKCLN